MALKIACKASDAEKHQFDVATIVCKNNLLYSGGDGGKIKVWSSDLKLQKEIQAHPTCVYCLTASDDTLYSCSNDGSIKAWELGSLAEKGTVFSNDNEIWRVLWKDGVLYAGDDQGFVNIIKDGSKHSEVNILEQVKDMCVDNHILFTSRDLDLVITEIMSDETGRSTTKKTINGRAPICLVDRYVCFGSREGRGILVHENSVESHFKEVAEHKEAHSMIINALLGAKRGGDVFVLSGGWDKEVKKWKLQGGNLEDSGSCSLGWVVNVLCNGNEGQIYAAGGEGNICRIDF